MEVVETVPSLHPLISLHNSISMKKMDVFLQSMTSDLDCEEILDSSDAFMQGGRFRHQESVIPS